MSGLGLPDPLLAQVLRWALAVLFGVSVVHKLADPPAFRRQLGDYRLLPRWLEVPAAALLVAAELAICVALLLPGLASAGASAAALLLMGYALAMGINLARGRRDIDCGCAGPAGRQNLSESLVIRNGLLALLACLAALPAAGRSLGAWDHLAGAAAVAALALLYTAAGNLLANAPRLKSLRLDHD